MSDVDENIPVILRLKSPSSDLKFLVKTSLLHVSKQGTETHLLSSRLGGPVAKYNTSFQKR